MRIGIFGRGRLGAAIADRARDEGVEVVWQVTRERGALAPVDVALEVSAGAAVAERLEWALAQGAPLVIGSTGWHFEDLAERVGDSIGVVVAPNFSLAVALLLDLSAVLGRFAALSPERDPYLLEHHHARKRDAPSGTALELARVLLEHCPRKTHWAAPAPRGPLPADCLSVSSVRAGSTWSSHTVGVDSPAEVLELRHEARNASPYAEGALLAARWIRGKSGVYPFSQLARELLAPLLEPRS